MGVKKIKRRAIKSTFMYMLRKLCLSDALEILDYYRDSIYLNGGTEDYAKECVNDLLDLYLKETE